MLIVPPLGRMLLEEPPHRPRTRTLMAPPLGRMLPEEPPQQLRTKTLLTAPPGGMTSSCGEATCLYTYPGKTRLRSTSSCRETTPRCRRRRSPLTNCCPGRTSEVRPFTTTPLQIPQDLPAAHRPPQPPRDASPVLLRSQITPPTPQQLRDDSPAPLRSPDTPAAPSTARRRGVNPPTRYSTPAPPRNSSRRGESSVLLRLSYHRRTLPPSPAVHQKMTRKAPTPHKMAASPQTPSTSNTPSLQMRSSAPSACRLDAFISSEGSPDT
ncbi:serine/arginine repetitive matrix protein 1-like [Gopherus flavomarginatus]|uniref:serine/arginine repetitive matrix protein 1-like n=1 Tax=Gopherus flavomarginatus TaxID=286002 RepID=UPI0021CBA853|nr:serine/arginine repetitive matrix protein 1-like [Gopherus flavomarginatus]